MIRWRRSVAITEAAVDSSGVQRQLWRWILYILYVAAAVFIIAKIWIYFPNTFLLYFNTTPKFRPDIHLISVTTRPLPPIALLSIDSITRHMPNATVNVHITVKENIPSAAADERKGILARQIQLFKSKGLDINLIFHDDFKSDFKGTPLAAMNINQRHMGGYYGVKPHVYFFPHVANFYRAFIMFKNGGIYMDYNHLLLRNLQPLFHMYGPNILVPDMINEIFNKCEYIDVTNGWIAVEPNHLLMEKLLIILADHVKRSGANFVFPWDDSPSFGSGYLWGVYGPAAITKVHRKRCQSYHPPLLVNEIPKRIRKQNPGLRGCVYLKSCPWDYDKLRHENYTIISRKYLSPLHWDPSIVTILIQHKSFLFSDSLESSYSPRVAREFTRTMRKLQAAYQVHAFGRLKDDWIDFAENRTQYPLLQYVHEKACKHL